MRYHALDSFRACMMLLGLALHSAMSYLSQPTEVWPFRDTQTSPLFDLLVFYIHIFRMPAFFVMSGFFAALLLERRGERGYAENRAQRILVPLGLGWIILFPLCVLGFAAGSQVQAPSVVNQSAAATGDKDPMQHILMHLWFLYYLAIFYTGSLALLWLRRRIGARITPDVTPLFRKALQSPWRSLYFAVPTLLTLLPMQHGLLETHPSLTPAPRILIAYAAFFGFGWLLYRQRDLLDSFRERAWLHLGLTLPPFCAMLWAVGHMAPLGEVEELRYRVVVAAASAWIAWLCIFGIAGLFLRYFSAPSFAGRYLADASYWLYLTHLPCTIWFPVLLAPVALPVGVKYALVLGLTTLVTLVTYDLFVRSTAVGVVLNGKRYPRALPALLNLRRKPAVPSAVE